MVRREEAWSIENQSFVTRNSHDFFHPILPRFFHPIFGIFSVDIGDLDIIIGKISILIKFAYWKLDKHTLWFIIHDYLGSISICRWFWIMIVFCTVQKLSHYSVTMTRYLIVLSISKSIIVERSEIWH